MEMLKFEEGGNGDPCQAPSGLILRQDKNSSVFRSSDRREVGKCAVVAGVTKAKLYQSTNVTCPSSHGIPVFQPFLS